MVKFLATGIACAVIDASSYAAALWALGASGLEGSVAVAVAKGAGFAAGTASAWKINKAWTFSDSKEESGAGWKFAALYGATLAANVAANGAALSAAEAAGLARGAALAVGFVASTGLSAACNYLGLKFWVFGGRKA